MRIEWVRGVAAAALVVAGSACIEQDRVAPTANEIIVHAVLDAAVRDQNVVVQTTTGAIYTQKPVTGAVVSMMLPDGRVVTADETRDSLTATPRFDQARITTVYRFSLDRLGITLVPGGTYTLHVRVPDGREVTGHTTIPTALPISASEPSIAMDRARDTLTLSWARVGGARSYEVFVASSLTRFSAFADTTILLAGTTRSADGGPPAFIAGQTHQVVVSAVDVNYYDYYRRGSDFYSGGGLIGHLDGALGLFGSIVPISTRSVIVR